MQHSRTILPEHAQGVIKVPSSPAVASPQHMRHTSGCSPQEPGGPPRLPEVLLIFKTLPGLPKGADDAVRGMLTT